MLLADPCWCCNQKLAAPEANPANPHMLRMSTRPLCSIFYVPTYPKPYPNYVTYILLFYYFIYLFIYNILIILLLTPYYFIYNILIIYPYIQ
jgi:hypothetical protein